MSLINEALKKAQRQRTEEPRSDAPSTDAATSRVTKRAAPMRAQSLVLLVAAAATLIVLSVVFTVLLVNRKPAEPPVGAPVALATPPAIDPNQPSPVIVAPVITPPLRASEPGAAAGVAPANTDAVTTALAAANVNPVPGAPAREPSPVPVIAKTQPSGPSVAPQATAVATPKQSAPPDPRILNFVDAIRVTGIRSSGTESKVLMNDRVFRVNELVERALGVKLVKVHSDSLTFEDANGVIYTKNF